ncbi:MAG: 16S rRNA (cytidine(1402)-2'-O)-methyltransferase [Dehalococcoidia bacterium]|jgi:16S rRNA (cytidine1402-2'-O)-methyltransferase|nr:16S rRNA (cytidine(1402)-2'-O)-methyltransferase [Dehalococcoidia bacterium]
MSILYIVATPIGNLEDITLRALRVLKDVSLIASEDTRTTAHLLKHYDIQTPLTSYFEHNKQSKLSYLLNKLEAGDIALVSEAGMPAISDPGYELVVAAQQRGFKVVPLPGASAFISALAVSGLPTDACHYLGFLPRKTGERKRLLESVAHEKVTLAAYETPHRLLVALHDILSVLGNRRVAVCRELTKLHEEVFRGTVEDSITHFVQPRGEFTIIIDGCTEKMMVVDVGDAVFRMGQLKRSGISTKEAMSQLHHETGIPRRELYREWLKLK